MVDLKDICTALLEQVNICRQDCVSNGILDTQRMRGSHGNNDTRTFRTCTMEEGPGKDEKQQKHRIPNPSNLPSYIAQAWPGRGMKSGDEISDSGYDAHGGRWMMSRVLRLVPTQPSRLGS